MALPLLHTPEQAAQWLRERIGAATTAALRADSRQVHTGDGFIAWPGAASDGRQYVAQALAHGAVACLVEADGVEKFGLENTTLNRHALACYPNLKADTGAIAAAFYQHPSHALDVVAFTGTNGKTSSAWWLAQALSALPDAQALPCGLIGTLGIGRPPMGSTPAHAPTAANASTIAAGDLVSSGMTTPDPVLLQHSLRRFADAGLRACAIEASSIGIEEQRLSGTRVRVAVLTNFTQDHLDYHADMDAYWQAKQRLFGWDGLRAAVLNIDDAKGAELADQLAAQLTTQSPHQTLDVWTTSCHDPRARLYARALGYGTTGLHFEVVEGAQVLPVQTQLIGSYNVANLLGVMAAMRCLGVPLAHVVAVCQGLQAVPGRMECIAQPNQPLVAVDYAHTPDALQQALAALRPMVQARGGKLWCVFGCGGDRDSSKRPLMGAIAAQRADHVIITSDNPRSENPEAIMAQIVGGITPNITTGSDAAAHVQVQSDRALAIAHSIAQADVRDVVLLAGKGHESTQDIAGVKTPFSDRAHAEHALQARTPMFQFQFQLHTALPWLSGASLVGDGLTAVQRVHTDTRTLTSGDLFVALRGERFDANTLLHEAQARGAAAVLCNAGLDAALLPAGMPRIEVPDTGVALCELAQHWRAQFQIPLIAVTGSNGKTTVTQMVAAILQAYAPDGGALATQGNFNNAIGVPLTLLRLRAAHRIAVVELGMNHPGEIALLAAMAQPTVALVNNAQREHMEFMHTVQAVAEENGSVIRALGQAGTAVFPADDSYTPLWESLAQTPTHAPTHTRRVARFALQADASTQAHDLICQSAAWQGDAWQVRAEGMGVSLQFALHIAGRHNVKNALAAAACALSAGVPRAAVEQGLKAFVPVKGRSRARLLAVQGRSHTLVDDSYNANPDSVRAAIDVLAQLPAPRLLVLGDMGEVGEQGPAFHQEAGQYAHAQGIEQVFGFGTLCQMAVAACPGARHFASIEALNAAVLQALPQCNSVLVKGSRSMRMERVVQALEAHAADLQNKGTLCS